MTSPLLRSALAIGFDYAGETLALVLNSGGSISPVVPAVTGARVLLADSTHDLLQVLQTALNAAASPATFAVTMSAATGKITIACTGDTFKWVGAGSSTIGKALGFTSSLTPFAASFTADEQSHYLALFVSRMSAGWAAKTPISASETAGGVSYGVTSGITRYEDELTLEFVPSDPTTKAAVDSLGTPWEPAAASLSTLGTHTGAWGVLDCLAVAIGQTCALARGNFQAIVSSSTERYDLVAIPAADLAAPRAPYQIAGWEAYRRLTIGMIRQSTPTGTRA